MNELQPISGLVHFANRHRQAITIGAGIWFWAGVAVYANFIALPDMPEWLRSGFFWAGVAVNAIWWGFLKPKVDAVDDSQSNNGD